jgi:DNA helicase-2/ATP-dependent DNA helicase PcrA
MIACALARRYPLIVCDEHQDCTEDQHSILMALHAAGSRMRIFGDPLQRLYTGKTDAAAKKDAKRWDDLKAKGKFAELEKPHRWANGSPKLGEWILEARRALLAGNPIDLTGSLPLNLAIVRADNTSQVRTQYQVSREDRQAIKSVMFANGPLIAMAINNEHVRAVNAAFGRRLRVWEGQTREALAELVEAASTFEGNPSEIAKAMIAFVNSFSAGFSMATHGKRLLQEIDEGCAKPTRGKPLLIQNLAKAIRDQPDHKGIAAALRLIDSYVAGSSDGFTDVKIDHKTEFAEAIRLGQFPSVEEGALELSRRRTHLRRLPPERSISTIHKAKGHECENAIVIPCDTQFSGSYYSRCRLYVALSRASHRLTLVIPRSRVSKLIKI